MSNSDSIECLHLNDIKLEEGSDYVDFNQSTTSPSISASNDPTTITIGSNNNRTANSSDELLSGSQQQQFSEENNTVTSAVSAFATEQLAVFNGLMRKLSTRKSGKTKTVEQMQSTGKSTGTRGGGSSGQQRSNNNNRTTNDFPLDRTLKVTRSSPTPSTVKGGDVHCSGNDGVGDNYHFQPSSTRSTRKSTDPILAMGLHYKFEQGNLSYPNITNSAIVSNNLEVSNRNNNFLQLTNEQHFNDMSGCSQTPDVTSELCFSAPTNSSNVGTPSGSSSVMNINGHHLSSGKNSNSNIASAVTKEVLSNAIGQRRAQQRRREWSRHRSSQNNQILLLQQQQQQLMLLQQNQVYN